MKESQIQNKIIKYLTQKGAYVIKTVIANRSGVPDLIVCYKGRFIAIEVKAENGKVSALQDFNLNQINSSGGLSIVARSAEDVEPFIKLLDGEL